MSVVYDTYEGQDKLSFEGDAWTKTTIRKSLA